MPRLLPIAAALLCAVSVPAAPAGASELAVRTPAPALLAKSTGRRETAIFAGGCFWGVEGVFEHVRGVIRATSGYAGGDRASASYEDVGSGRTRHAEAVQVVFDPARIDYAELLRIYFGVIADPTLVNRQGPDQGPQYRTALFPLTKAQATVARAYIAQLKAARLFDRPIVTRLERQQGFFAAEPYHQDFMEKNPTYPYVVVNDWPKVRALKRLFPQYWRP